MVSLPRSARAHLIIPVQYLNGYVRKEWLMDATLSQGRAERGRTHTTARTRHSGRRSRGNCAGTNAAPPSPSCR